MVKRMGKLRAKSRRSEGPLTRLSLFQLSLFRPVGLGGGQDGYKTGPSSSGHMPWRCLSIATCHCHYHVNRPSCQSDKRAAIEHFVEADLSAMDRVIQHCIYANQSGQSIAKTASACCCRGSSFWTTIFGARQKSVGGRFWANHVWVQ